ncbi:hypothetical protein ACIPQJ_17500 [Streptomyces sp. NPDC090082]|uniref:hypothetical protein n=1 Tax=unclassified Streptomyces TaxID=2593676 RepID=UPI00382A45DA
MAQGDQTEPGHEQRCAAEPDARDEHRTSSPKSLLPDVSWQPAAWQASEKESVDAEHNSREADSTDDHNQWQKRYRE